MCIMPGQHLIGSRAYSRSWNSATLLTVSLTDMHANVYLSQWLIIIVVHVEGRALVASFVRCHSIFNRVGP